MRQRSQPPEGLWRYRHSLLLDLDVDFDIGNEEEMDSSLRSPNTGSLPSAAGNKPPTSPGAKSVDIGCVNMKYYDDYQVLDIGPFLDKHRNVGNRVRANSEFDDVQIPPSIFDSTGTTVSDIKTEQRKHSHAVVITMDDLNPPQQHHHHHHFDHRKIPGALNSHFSVINEDTTAEDDDVVVGEDAAASVDSVEVSKIRNFVAAAKLNDSKHHLDQETDECSSSSSCVVQQVIEGSNLLADTMSEHTKHTKNEMLTTVNGDQLECFDREDFPGVPKEVSDVISDIIDKVCESH